MTQLTPEEIWNAYQEAERKRTAHSGGPASGGLTVRDYFAAKAMQVYLQATIGQTIHLNNVAENAYMMADAMLTERSK